MRHQNDKNCNTYGEYEGPGESPTAALCNGGWFDGKRWEACPQKDSCRVETRSQSRSGRVTLPTITPRGSFRTIATTPNLTRGRTRASKPATTNQSMTSAPPALDPRNPYLATERAPHQMGPSPTFIPKKKEGVFKRLSKNIAQGWVASFGWHMFDMAQQVDMFPEEEDDEDPPNQT